MIDVCMLSPSNSSRFKLGVPGAVPGVRAVLASPPRLAGAAALLSIYLFTT